MYISVLNTHVKENNKSEGNLTFNTRINSTSFHSTDAFLNLHLQVIPYANLEWEKLVFVFTLSSMYSATHFDGARYYVQGDAPLLSSSSGARRALQAHGVMRDSASPPLAITN